MSRIRCLDVSTRIRLSNQKRHFSESQSKKCRFSSLRSVVSVGVALLEANRELHNVVIDLLFLLHSVTDSSAGMHYCGVIASAKDLSNIHQAHTGHFASQIHGDLTRNSHVFGS